MSQHSTYAQAREGSATAAASQIVTLDPALLKSGVADCFSEVPAPRTAVVAKPIASVGTSPHARPSPAIFSSGFLRVSCPRQSARCATRVNRIAVARLARPYRRLTEKPDHVPQRCGTHWLKAAGRRRRRAPRANRGILRNAHEGPHALSIGAVVMNRGTVDLKQTNGVSCVRGPRIPFADLLLN